MFRCWIALALVAALWAGRAEAAELTGFGPIKFGMTKEQAKAALEAAGIETKFEVRYWLEYHYPNHKPVVREDEWTKFKVVQTFENGFAADTTVELRWPDAYPGVCFFEGLNFVSAVLSKYHDARVIREEIDRTIWDHGKDVVARVYLIPFKNEAFIKMVLFDDVKDHEYSECRFWVLYHAPVSNPIPF